MVEKSGKIGKIKIIDVAFCLMILASFLGTISLLNTPIGTLTPARIGLIVMIVAMITTKTSTKRLRFLLSVDNFPFWFLPGFASISLIWTIADKTFAINYLSNLITGLTISFICVIYTDTYSRLINYWLFFRIGCWLHIIMAAIELVFGLRFSTSSLEQSGVSEYAVEFNRFTPTGLAGNPNTLAFLLGCFIIHLIIYKEENFVFRLFGIFIASVIVLLTDSRSVMMSIFLFLSIHIFTSLRQNKLNLFRFAVKIFFITITIAGIITVLVNSIYDEQIWDKLNRIDLFSIMTEILDDNENTTSGGMRKDLAGLAITGLFNRFLLGAGVGGTINLMSSVNTEGLLITNPHNFWIELLTDYGIVPFTLLILWLTNIFRQLHFLSQSILIDIKLSHLLSSSKGIIIYMIIAATAPSSLSSVWFFYVVIGLLVSTLTIGKYADVNN